jgi:hypothetical protein
MEKDKRNERERGEEKKYTPVMHSTGYLTFNKSHNGMYAIGFFVSKYSARVYYQLV